MRRLTGLDAGFLLLESPTTHMHVASVGVFDPSTMKGGYSFDRLRDLVASRLHLLPPFRWKLVEIPFGLHHPLWVNDPGFDLDFHVRRTALPPPGDLAALRRFVSETVGRPLDRSRPLWEMYVIEGLADGRFGVLTKTHHAAIDGVSGIELTVNLLDLEPEPAAVAPEAEPWKPDRIPSDAELVAYAMASLARQPLVAAKAVRRTAMLGLNLWRHNRQAEVQPPPAPFAAPPTSLNVPITAHREYGMVRIPFRDVKAAKDALGGTVNDVVLTLCAGALRSYFDRRGEHPEAPLVAMVPISVRTEDEKGTMGNKVSSLLTTLATDVDDVLERHALIRQGTASAKDQERAVPAWELTNWLEFAAPAVAAQAARLVSTLRVAERMRPIFNVVISNVPGPDFPLYSAGAQLEAIYPMGPIASGVALNITVMSYLGDMFFGLLACREAVPEVQQIADGIAESLVQLLEAAGVASAAGG